MWERGLKLQCSQKQVSVPLVAPHVGAWIETYDTYQYVRTIQVAPHVGAWIETCP